MEVIWQQLEVSTTLHIAGYVKKAYFRSKNTNFEVLVRGKREKMKNRRWRPLELSMGDRMEVIWHQLEVSTTLYIAGCVKNGYFCLKIEIFNPGSCRITLLRWKNQL